MDYSQRRKLLQIYRKQREDTNTNPVGEATGRTYIPIPQELLDEGKNALGFNGFIRMFRKMLEHSPIEVRPGELIVGDYYFLLPYEIIPMDPPINTDEIAKLGALPVVPMGHSSVNAHKGLSLGWNGILKLIIESRKKYASGTPQAAFLDAEAEVVHIIQDRIRGYGERASCLAKLAASSEQISEYETIAERCFRLATDPPQTFHDALQWYFFFVIFERSTSTGMGSIRMDQDFFPFYQRDIDQEILDDSQVQMLLECMFMKEPLFWGIGGVTPEGKDATNPLSFLALKAYQAVGGASNLSLRWHPSINPNLEKKASEILAGGTGVPSVVNDDVIIPSLVEFGFPLEQARNYNFSGCFWWDVPGKEYTYHDLAGFSGVRSLNRALTAFGREGAPTFEELWNCYQQYAEEGIHALLDAYEIIDPWLAKRYPEMVVSLLMDGCLEKGQGFNDQGPERNMMTILYVGLANVANSLYAIKKNIYDDEKISYSDMLSALENNFIGYERLHNVLKNTSKYGNGDEEADEIAVMVAEHFKSCLRKYRNSKGDRLRPAFYSWHRQTFEGAILGATPDGRLAGEPLAYAGNPSSGTTRKGITAAITSMTRIDYKDTAGGPIFLLLQQDENKALMQETIHSLIRSSFQMGAVHVIVNLADGKILRDAIDHPEKYPDLVIRVTGYSAKFNQLERRYQEEIAARNSF